MFHDTALKLPGVLEPAAMDAAKQVKAGYRYLNPYAYPLNTIGKPEAMKKLLTFCKSRKIYGLGRWGEHCHYNSDVVVELALQLAEKLVQT